MSLSESINKNYNTQDILKNLTQNFRTSNISNYNKTSNLVSNVNNTFEKNFNLQKLSQIKDINIFDQINIISEPKINKTIKVLRKLKQINNIENLDQNISLVNQTLSDKKEYFVKTSNVNKVNKFINLIENSKLNSTQINAISQLSVQNLSNIVQTINNISNNDNNINKIVNEISKISENKITKISNINQNQIQNINLTKNEVQSVVRLERQIRSYSEKVKVRETLKTLDLVQSNPDINQIFTNKISYTKLNQISEVLQNINLTKTEKNLEVIKKYSFDSNKKNISNFFNELNVVSLFKTERKTEKTFSSINKQIDRLYRMNERVESKAARAEQSFYDLINFSDYSVTKKTSTKKEIKNFFQTLNQVKITNEQVRQRTKPSVKVSEFRITQSSEKVKIDIHKQKTDNYYKVENVNRFYKKSYFEEKQEKEAQEKVIESKVEELLVQKIQHVTNNITNNVITKQEINNIKQEIIREIFKVEEKYEKKIQAIKQETQQTVQSMLNQFLKS